MTGQQAGRKSGQLVVHTHDGDDLIFDSSALSAAYEGRTRDDHTIEVRIVVSDATTGRHQEFSVRHFPPNEATGFEER